MTTLETIRAQLADYLATPASYPLVQADPLTQDMLNREAAKHDRRRYAAEPGPVSAFSQLQEQA